MGIGARVEEHFQDFAQQAHAARLGMWLFLATESLLFGVLFIGYAFYRSLFPAVFALASRRLDITLGTANTFVLITSSFTVALGLHLLRAGRRALAAAALSITVALAVTFLLVKGFEWANDFREEIYPGTGSPQAPLTAPGAALFYTLYFLMGGLHGLHVMVGAGLLAWLDARTIRGSLTPEYTTPLEVVALYWHLVDIIWIFLYPLLYLVT